MSSINLNPFKITTLKTDSGYLLKRRSGSYKLIKATTVESWWFLSYQTETTKVAIVERLSCTGLPIFRGKKKQNVAGFSGANPRKNRPISRDFRGRKVKISKKIGRFRGLLGEKSPISKDFQGQILRKIGRFHRKFRGETWPRNNQ